MAYAAIAGLPIVNGIICSAVAALAAPLFASSRHTILGPTNATSFMLFSFFAIAGQEQVTELVPLLVLLVGLLSLVGAFLKVADLLQFISRSVLVGYISGAAVLIIANQFKHLLGIDATGRTFAHVLGSLAESLPAAQWQPLAAGLATLLLYFLLLRKFPRLPVFALTLVLASAAVFLAGKAAPHLGFQRLATFEGFGFDAFRPRLPSLGPYPGLYDALSHLALVALAIAFLASLENTVMAKTLASRTGDRPDANQDMLAVGAANLACSCLAGMPASGSLTRSALNFSSGALTRLSSVFCGLLCLLGALLLAALPLVTHIPKAALAALVIAIALSLLSPPAIRICLRSTKGDALVLLATFAAALFTPLHVAIFIGVAISLALFLRKAAHPQLVEYALDDEGALQQLGEKRPRPNPAISIVHVEGDLFFAAAELFRTQVQRLLADPNLRLLVLRLKNARHLDATSVMALADLIRATRAQGRHLLVSGATREVHRVLRRSGILALLQQGADPAKGESNLFMHTPANPNLSTRDALKRAQQLLGTAKADIKIYYDPTKDRSS